MTGPGPASDARATRWLPVAVLSIFALVLLSDAVVIALYGNYRNLVEENEVEITFQPSQPVGVDGAGDAANVTEGLTMVAADGTVLVERTDGGLAVRAPGDLVVRFRAPDAGSTMVFDYRFGRRRRGARCEVALARVASRYGVDTVWRKSLDGGRKARGKIRHYLADHVGWFQLRIEVNEEAAETGFELTVPTTNWGKPPPCKEHRAAQHITHQ